MSKGRGCGIAAALVAGGCLTLLLIVGIGGYMAYHGVKKIATTLLEDYTDTQPRALPEVQVSEPEAQALVARFDAFKDGLKEGRAVPPLELSGEDINRLIHHHPAFQEAAGHVYVTIEADRIKGEITIPLEQFGPLVQGRYLNGSAVFRIQLMGGRIVLFVDSIEVKGKPVPEQIMQEIRAKNLAEDSNTDPDTAAALDKIESVTVQNGKLRIVPKTTE
ncbi:MAG: hypothetical protein JXR37_06130 [Kiritimatiellae bacterium]|nr:hypothetical protein [Kiritimatiellia bacterium]